MWLRFRKGDATDPLAFVQPQRRILHMCIVSAPAGRTGTGALSRPTPSSQSHIFHASLNVSSIFPYFPSTIQKMCYFKLPTIKVEMFKLEMPKSAVVPAVLCSVLGSFAQVLIGSTHLFLVEQYVCREHYRMIEIATIGNGDRIYESLCKIPKIQSAVAGIMGTFSVLTFMPGK
jgi:hypothetical protein